MNKLALIFPALLLSVACKGSVQEAQSPQAQSTPPVSANPSPTFTECASSGWDKTKETAGTLYDKSMEFYREYEASHRSEQ